MLEIFQGKLGGLPPPFRFPQVAAPSHPDLDRGAFCDRNSFVIDRGQHFERVVHFHPEHLPQAVALAFDPRLRPGELRLRTKLLDPEAERLHLGDQPDLELAQGEIEGGRRLLEPLFLDLELADRLHEVVKGVGDLLLELQLAAVQVRLADRQPEFRLLQLDFRGRSEEKVASVGDLEIADELAPVDAAIGAEVVARSRCGDAEPADMGNPLRQRRPALVFHGGVLFADSLDQGDVVLELAALGIGREVEGGVDVQPEFRARLAQLLPGGLDIAKVAEVSEILYGRQIDAFPQREGRGRGGASGEQGEGEGGRGQGQAFLPQGIPSAVWHGVKFSQVFVF